MPGWTPFVDWMRYNRLDDGEGLTQAFVLSYKITDDDGTDAWTGRLNRFKSKDRVARAGAVHTFREAVPDLIEALGLVAVRTLFVPALSSGETAASENGFNSVLARRGAEACGSPYDLGILSKKAHRPIHSVGGASSRDEELDKAEYKAVRLHNSIRNVVIVDDLITRGGTMSRIAQALHAENEGLTIYGIALGKTERRAYWGNLTNDHVPRRWSRLWEAGEQRYQARRAGG